MNKKRKQNEVSKEKRKFVSLFLLLLPPKSLLKEKSWLIMAVLFVIVRWLVNPPVSFWPLAFVAYIPWLYALKSRTVREGFWISFAFGFLQNLALYSWLLSLMRFNPAIVLGWPLLALFQGIFLGFAGVLFLKISRTTSVTLTYLLSAASFCGIEYFRSVGALAAPYAMAGQMLLENDWLRQLASIGGVPIISFLVILCNFVLYEAFLVIRAKAIDASFIIRAATLLIVMILASIYGWRTQSQLQEKWQNAPEINVALLQPNVLQETKFASYSDPDSSNRLRLQTQMTAELLEMMDTLERDSVQLIMTPESAVTAPGFDRDPDLQREFSRRAQELNASILVGADDIVFHALAGGFTENQYEASYSSDGYYNIESFGALYYFEPNIQEELKQAADYQKIHLMPFGETIPYLHVIPGVQELVQIGMMKAGERDQPPLYLRYQDEQLQEQVIPLGANICFEDMFAGLFFRYNRQGVRLFVNTTNNAWFDPSLGSTYHFQFSRFRSIEFQTPAIRATNTGITAVVYPDGSVVEQLPVREKQLQIVTVKVPENTGPTLYGRFGDWFAWLMMLLTVGSFVLVLKSRKAEEFLSAEER